VFLGNLGSFGNGSSDISAFGYANTDLALVVANDDEGAEAEATAASHYAGYTVDVHNALVKFFLFFCLRSAVVATTRWTGCALTLVCGSLSHIKTPILSRGLR
jgi:hypothetical protein